MRIIKQNETERIHKCENCRSIYAYLPEDINPVLTPTTRCPVCKTINSVSIFDKKVKNK